jgi:hypothetical protein
VDNLYGVLEIKLWPLKHLIHPPVAKKHTYGGNKEWNVVVILAVEK